MPWDMHKPISEGRNNYGQLEGDIASFGRLPLTDIHNYSHAAYQNGGQNVGSPYRYIATSGKSVDELVTLGPNNGRAAPANSATLSNLMS